MANIKRNNTSHLNIIPVAGRLSIACIYATVNGMPWRIKFIKNIKFNFNAVYLQKGASTFSFFISDSALLITVSTAYRNCQLRFCYVDKIKL